MRAIGPTEGKEPTIALRAAREDDDLTRFQDGPEPQRDRAVAHAPLDDVVGEDVARRLVQQADRTRSRVEGAARLVGGEVTVGTEAEHDDVETARGGNRRFVLGAHGVEIGRVDNERPAAIAVHARPGEKLGADLTPEVSIRGRRRTQLVHRKNPHVRCHLGQLLGVARDDDLHGRSVAKR